MAKIQHPTLTSVFYTVPDDRLEDWVAAGWRECPAEVDGQAPPGEDEPGGAVDDDPEPKK